MKINLISNSDLGENSDLRFNSCLDQNIFVSYNPIPKGFDKNIYRIYFDFGLDIKLPQKCNKTDLIYVVVGDSHHLPSLLLSLYGYLMQNHTKIESVFFYGKPTQYRFFQTLGLENIKPAPIDWYFLEAKSQIQDLKFLNHDRAHDFSICRSTGNTHQFKRNNEVSSISDLNISFHDFLSKEEYLRHLANTYKYIVVSNCLQFNPQWFFCMMAGTIPLVNGIAHSFYLLYPELSELPIVDYSLFGLRPFLHGLPVKNLQSNLFTPSLKSSTEWKGEIFSVLSEIKSSTSNSTHSLSSQRCCLLNDSNIELYKKFVVHYLAIYEICQQLIKFSSHYYTFDLLQHDHEFNQFLFDDLHLATSSHYAKISITFRVCSASVHLMFQAQILNDPDQNFSLDSDNMEKSLQVIIKCLRDRFGICMHVDLSSIIKMANVVSATVL